MKVTSFSVVGRGEADRWLEECLQQLHWVDEVAVCLNRADKKTEKIVRKYATVVSVDDREWGKEQWRIKQDLLATIGKTKPEWIWCLDADEMFGESWNRAEAERLTRGHDIAWYFWVLQCWNGPDTIREDLSFPNIRFYEYRPDFNVAFQATPLHCGLAPQYAYRYGSQSNLWYRHYGLMKREDRQKKIERYDRYDPHAKYKAKMWYDGLRNEKAKVTPIQDVINKLPSTIMKGKPIVAQRGKDKSMFLFRNKWGKVVEAVGEKQRVEFVKRGMMEIQPIENSTMEVEAPVVKTEAVEPPKKKGRPKKA